MNIDYAQNQGPSPDLGIEVRQPNVCSSGDRLFVLSAWRRIRVRKFEVRTDITLTLEAQPRVGRLPRGFPNRSSVYLHHWECVEDSLRVTVRASGELGVRTSAGHGTLAMLCKTKFRGMHGTEGWALGTG